MGQAGRFRIGTAILIAMVISISTPDAANAAVMTSVFDQDSGHNTYGGGLGTGNWVSAIYQATPHSGSDFFSSANGSTGVDFPGLSLTKQLGGTIPDQPCDVSFWITTYGNPGSGIDGGIAFADFSVLRIGGSNGTMQWQQTPTPKVNGKWMQYDGVFTPAASDVGEPFVFTATWLERQHTAIALDGPIVAEIPEPACGFVLGAGVMLVAFRRQVAK